MEALLVSTLVVALGEIGDKTQLLALLLAARFRRPVPIILGIFVATIANHALAGLVGAWVRTTLSPEWLRWILGLSFIAVALWALKPDTLDEQDAALHGSWGVFALTVISFFLAEMGDKTQVATVMLAAKYESLLQVVAGTTLGMLVADVPAVFVGNLAALKLPVTAIRRIAAAIFAVLGIATIAGFAF
jgi:putative Ca2+/H+ antiporter (TMEM165/GDT1 family)